MKLILASQSPIRRVMLEAAGVPHEAVSAGVDEVAAKESLRSRQIAPRDLADALAELKALKISAREPDALVLGCDSVVGLDDGTILDKAATREEAAEQLQRMSGKTHSLFSAAVAAEGGKPVWRHVEEARMQVRALSSSFIENYLNEEWPDVSGCVGCYRLEGRGAQLFVRIQGSHFAVLGLPLLPLLEYLRVRQVVPR